MSRSAPLVRGVCPSCGHEALYLTNSGFVMCSASGCVEPTAACEVLHLEPIHIATLGPNRYHLEHPAICRLNGRPLADCPVDQAIRDLSPVDVLAMPREPQIAKLVDGELRLADAPTMLTPDQWSRQIGTWVLAPDGWRTGFTQPDGTSYEPKPFRSAIIRAEFDARAAHSTTAHHRPSDPVPTEGHDDDGDD